MATAEATSPVMSNAAPAAPRRLAFDPFHHAQFFKIENLRISASANKHPQIRFETDCPAGQVRAGTITLVPATPPTMRGPGLPETVIINGRMADFTPEHRDELGKHAVRFTSELGDASRSQNGKAKTFWTAFIPSDRALEVADVLQGLKTRNGKPDATGAFTALAIRIFDEKLKNLNVDNPLG